jgi:hypothetical protein
VHETTQFKRFRLFTAFLCVAWLCLPVARAADAQAKIYVILWFDTEDYILPASDDAALHIAEFLSREKIRATFKVVGEKARTLERRGRSDVIAALTKHEIGYHSNFHSVQPTPALYLADLSWDEGVAEFDRREKPGWDDVKRIFGVAPTCYGQPGSSWAPQSYGAMNHWGMRVYLDAGNHVRLDDRPCDYCGILNLYKLRFLLRAGLAGSRDLEEAEQKFIAARQQLLIEGGGVVSTMYHPCEFVHKQFWDGVNFRGGANPPLEQWKLPPTKSPEETRVAYRVFEEYIRFLKRFPEVQFITASDAGRLYRDRARGRSFTSAEIAKIAAKVSPDVSFQDHGDFTLAASEVFSLLNTYVASGSREQPISITLDTTPYGPSDPVSALPAPVTTNDSQFLRTAADVAGFLRRHGRVPSSVWLGSTPVPPEAYLQALAHTVLKLANGETMPKSIEVKPARLAAADYVSDDVPGLWRWVIFPPGFRAPRMMELAKRQAWTLKPAIKTDN